MTDKQVLYILLLILAIIAVASWLLFFPGCSLLSRDDVSKISTELKTVKEDVDKSKKEYGDINGTLTAIENRISHVETNVVTIQNTIKNVKNTPFWQIWIPLVGAYFVWEILKYKYLKPLVKKKE